MNEKLNLKSTQECSQFIAKFLRQISSTESQCLGLVVSIQLIHREQRNTIKKTGSSIPTVQHISKASLDHYTTTYLQALVNMKRVSLTLTDSVVKTYRNYVILYTLKDVLIDMLTCI
ncbi:hypothetical protein pdam_00009100 [Pocillopora damicornis]|uniref:Uncharacterized protein n=1 Tax=Pocillopora damicornis TaxID=46731 RepID=A0A3M6V2U4_POCDA|nr:hypothetical protein pdam_00009100 [Pocillopora damicornis]